MAIVEAEPIAANVLGTIGTDYGASKIWTNWKTKATDGLPSAMVLLWAVAAVPFGTYAVVQHFNTPLQIQPQLLCLLSLISWAQILVYGNGCSWFKASAYAIATALLFGGIEAVLIVTLRPLYDRGIAYPMIVVGIIASIIIALGLLPPYYEMWKRHGRVVGINLVFILIDLLGALFSLAALIAQRKFDVLGGVLYIIVIILELGIFASHYIWFLRTRHIRRAAASEGKTFDDLLEEKANAGTPWKFTERRFCFKDVGKCNGDVEMQRDRSGCEGFGSETQRPSTATTLSVEENPAVTPDESRTMS